MSTKPTSRADPGQSGASVRDAGGRLSAARAAASRQTVRRLLMLLAMLLVVGGFLYPDPRTLAASISRLIHPPVDVAAVQQMAAGLPADPHVIDSFASDYVHFDNPWDLYGVPWYFPTASEVLRDKAGDCQAIAVLTASLFEARGLPYTLRYSFDHVWVDYPGKQVTTLEDPATAFVSDQGQGWLASLPQKLPIASIIRERVAFHWSPMPLPRKVGLLTALLALTLLSEGPALRRVLARASVRRSRSGGQGAPYLAEDAGER